MPFAVRSRRRANVFWTRPPTRSLLPTVSNFLRRWRFPMLVLLAVSLTVTACGRRPANVSAPQGEQEDTFPGRYPAY